MRNAITGLLLAGATSALLATSAFAQVAGNPGDLHTPTPYTNEVRANTYGYTPGCGWTSGSVYRSVHSRAPRSYERRARRWRVWGQPGLQRPADRALRPVI